MSEHGNRLEDIGVGRILKFWPLLVAIFTAGAWYQSASSTREVMNVIKIQTDDHEKRLVRVEECVVYLKDIVEREENRRH